MSARIKAIRDNDAQALYALEATDAEDPTAPWKDAVVEGKGALPKLFPSTTCSWSGSTATPAKHAGQRALFVDGGSRVSCGIFRFSSR